jgi:hypothetical protein
MPIRRLPSLCGGKFKFNSVQPEGNDTWRIDAVCTVIGESPYAARAKSLVRRHDPTEAGDALRGVYTGGANHPPRAQRLLDQRGSLGGIGLPMVRGLPATRRLSADRKMGSQSRRLVQAKRRRTSCSRRHRGFLGLPIRTSAAEIGPTVLFAQL